MDIMELVKLTTRAWSLEILTGLNEGVPGRQAPLLARTGASRTAFRDSLDHLFQLGLLERNPGHGHPLRPEFRLTEKGQALAMTAATITGVSDKAGRALLRKSWTVPVLALTMTPSRFTGIKHGLPGITDRALSKSLEGLQDQQWIRRDVDVRARPLRPTYQAVNAGRQIALVTQGFAG